MMTPPPTWDDVAWLPRAVGRPVHAQGHLPGRRRAGRAVDAGVTAISVSNHGGNNLDGTPAPIRRCPRSPRRSATTSRCCSTAASGAAATSSRRSPSARRRCLIGRAYLWGLAANGQAGVENVLDILRGGIDSALLGMGHSSIHDLGPDDIVIPDGFTRSPRVTGSA